MSKKLFIKTWGCQMNEYDSEKMADLLDATHGYSLAEEAEEAKQERSRPGYRRCAAEASVRLDGTDVEP